MTVDNLIHAINKGESWCQVISCVQQICVSEVQISCTSRAQSCIGKSRFKPLVSIPVLDGFCFHATLFDMSTKKTSPAARHLPIPVELIERRIYLIRGEKVMLDSDLAELYEVQTKALNQAVKRNRDRFPEDFMFQLTKEESDALLNRSHIVTGSQKHRDPRLRPYAFTEQGVAMLSSVLRSSRAVQVNIVIMRAFVQLRRMMLSNEELNRKFTALERKLSTHDKYFKVVFDELRKLMAAPDKPTRQIGFKTDEKK